MKQPYFPYFEQENIASLLYCPDTRIYQRGKNLGHFPQEDPNKITKKKNIVSV